MSQRRISYFVIEWSSWSTTGLRWPKGQSQWSGNVNTNTMMDEDQECHDVGAVCQNTQARTAGDGHFALECPSGKGFGKNEVKRMAEDGRGTEV